MKTREQLLEKLKDCNIKYSELTNGKFEAILKLLKEQDEELDRIHEEIESAGYDGEIDFIDKIMEIQDHPTVKKNNDLLDTISMYI